jgi:hypothetical protein
MPALDSIRAGSPLNDKKGGLTMVDEEKLGKLKNRQIISVRNLEKAYP